MKEVSPPLTLLSPEAMACPFDTYDAMRAESAAYKDAFTGFYVVTRYDDLRAVMTNPETFSSKVDGLAARSSIQEELDRMYADAGLALAEVIVGVDPPVHRRHRSLVDKVFSPRRVREAEPGIAAQIDSLVARFPSGPFDFHDQFALPLPMWIIADQLGLPQDRKEDFKRWSDASVNLVNQGRSNEQEIADARAVIEMRLYFIEQVARVRSSPNASLLSALANTENDGGELMTPNELSLLFQVLLAAGNETTTHATGSAMYRLTQDSDLQDHLRAEPALIPAFIEEVLRLDAPLQGLFRIARKATKIGDVEIPEGAIINVRFGAGNRDAAQFACPSEVDLDRGRPSHMTFGYGIHHCIGSQLARAELRLAFERLLGGSKAITLAHVPDAYVVPPHFVARGPRRLMVEFQPA